MFDRLLTLDTYFSDFGISASYIMGGKDVFNFKVIRDTFNEDYKHSRINSIVIRAKTSDVANIEEKGIITIDTVNYKIFKKDKLLDGVFTKLYLEVSING